MRELHGDRFDALSAGSNPAGYVHPGAVAAMNELGIDISHQVSKSIAEFLPPEGMPPDVIISVCSDAEKDCPTFPGATRRLHWPFDDPARATGNDAEKAAVFERVRDEIRQSLIDRLNELLG